MLLLALAMHGAAIAPDQKRARPVRRATIAARNVRALPVDVCGAACRRDPGMRYRVPGTPHDFNAKERAVRNPGMACGTTGAPVCPHNGMPLLKSNPDD